MKKTLFLSFFALTVIFCKGQNSFGWYHLLKGSKTRILDNWVDNNKTDVWYSVDEILLVFEFKGDAAFAIDVDGRLVQILDISKTHKIEMSGRVVKMTKNVDITLEKVLQVNNNVWLVGFNSANNTAKILLSNGEIVEVPKSSYVEISQYYLNKNRGYSIRETSSE